MKQVFCLLLIGSACFGSINGKTICLNMIVKDEAPVIKRCLDSVRHLIDYYVIVDTGSTDGTQAVVRETLKDIPGKLYEKPWKNFGFNRHEALKLALGTGDYLLFIDADETLAISPDCTFPSLSDDVYMSFGSSPGNNPDFQRVLFLKNDDSWSWSGVIHEQLRSTRNPLTKSQLSGVRIMANTMDGHRSLDPNKHYKDAILLKNALDDEPDNADYVFYMAQSYFNADKFELAKQAYAKRSTMGGWDEAVFWSLFCVALISQKLGEGVEVVASAYLKAYEARPTRSEPLFFLADHYLSNKRPQTALLYAEKARQLPMPEDSGYIINKIYEYQGELVYGKCALACGKYQQAKEAFKNVLQHSKASLEEQNQIAYFLRTAFPSSRPFGASVAGFTE